jgi:hypothetical protein
MPPEHTVLYEVTLQVEPSLAGAVEDHMRRQHIPEILRTGCFERIRFDQASPSRFRTSYQARSSAELERYLRDHAPRLRADFQAHFPSGVTLTRETWSPRELWQSE